MLELAKYTSIPNILGPTHWWLYPCVGIRKTSYEVMIILEGMHFEKVMYA
jgi:hypothetical protein